VILDDLVLDVSHFMTEHPGGRFLIEHNIGRDVSKFFYGGYVMENGVGLSPHRHTNVARTIVNKIIVARLNNKS
jgi:cytochrome b involved in lipid metabolism